MSNSYPSDVSSYCPISTVYLVFFWRKNFKGFFIVSYPDVFTDTTQIGAIHIAVGCYRDSLGFLYILENNGNNRKSNAVLLPTFK